MTTAQELKSLYDITGKITDHNTLLINKGDLDRLTAQVEQYKADAEMLEWLSHQGVSFGFQDIYEGNRWEIAGPYATLRIAIASEMKGQP